MPVRAFGAVRARISFAARCLIQFPLKVVSVQASTLSHPGLKAGDSSIRYWGAFGSLLRFVSLDSANDGDCARPVFILDSRLRGNDEWVGVCEKECRVQGSSGVMKKDEKLFRSAVRLHRNDDGNVVMFSPLWLRSCCSYYSNVSTRHSRVGGNPVKIFWGRNATWK